VADRIWTPTPTDQPNLRLHRRRCRRTNSTVDQPSHRALLLGFLVVGCTQARQSHLALNLTELNAIELSGSFLPRGAHLTAQGDVLYWNDTSMFTSRRTGVERLELCEGQLNRVVAAAFVSGDSIINILEASEPAIIRATVSGGCQRQPFQAGTAEVTSGIVSPERVTVALRRGAVTAEVLSVTFGSELHKLFEYSHSPKSPFDLNASFVTGNSTRTLLASMNWPFEWVALDSTGHVILRAQAVDRTGDQSSDTLLVAWVGLPVVQLDSGFLQTIADPRSDRRILVRYDSEGRVRSRAEITMAFGVLSARPEQRLLLALRRSDRTELVLYRWDWRRSQ